MKWREKEKRRAARRRAQPAGASKESSRPLETLFDEARLEPLLIEHGGAKERHGGREAAECQRRRRR